MNKKLISAVLLVLIVIIASTIWIVLRPSKNISALEYIDRAQSIVEENYTGEYILSSVGASGIDKFGKASQWEYRYWFNNDTWMGEIRIHIFSNNTAYKTDYFFPFNLTVWNSLLINEMIDVPLIDSDQVVEIIVQSDLPVSYDTYTYLICSNLGNRTIWFCYSEGIKVISVDAMTGEIIE
ncbi:MAG: hypothetical protein KAX31_07290 [Thermoplasmata archaeon]|nr:hypothetical protein [Thermoplasmata archaeon]